MSDVQDEDFGFLGSYTVSRMLGHEIKEPITYKNGLAELWEEIDREYYPPEDSPNYDLGGDPEHLLECLYKRYHKKENTSVEIRFNNILKKYSTKVSEEVLKKKVKAEIDKVKKSLLDTEKETAGNLLTYIGNGVINSWRRSKKPSQDGRLILYKLSFALDMSLDDHFKLFSDVFKLKPLLRIPEELCLTYCKNQDNKTYLDAVRMYIDYCKRQKEKYSSKEMWNESDNTKVFAERIMFNEPETFVNELVNNSDKLFISGETIVKNIKVILNSEDANLDYIKTSIADLYKLQEYDCQDFLYNSMKKCMTMETDESKPGRKKKFEEFLKETGLDEFYINMESAINKTSGNTYNVLQLRKIYIICYMLQKKNFWKTKISTQQKEAFCSFILSLNKKLLDMNLPKLDYLDNFDRGIILSALYINLTGGGIFKKEENILLSELICRIVMDPKLFKE